jgi:hypothetical protein
MSRPDQDTAESVIAGIGGQTRDMTQQFGVRE